MMVFLLQCGTTTQWLKIMWRFWDEFFLFVFSHFLSFLSNASLLFVTSVLLNTTKNTLNTNQHVEEHQPAWARSTRTQPRRRKQREEEESDDADDALEEERCAQTWKKKRPSLLSSSTNNRRRLFRRRLRWWWYCCVLSWCSRGGGRRRKGVVGFFVSRHVARDAQY